MKPEDVDQLVAILRGAQYEVGPRDAAVTALAAVIIFLESVPDIRDEELSWLLSMLSFALTDLGRGQVWPILEKPRQGEKQAATRSHQEKPAERQEQAATRSHQEKPAERKKRAATRPPPPFGQDFLRVRAAGQLSVRIERG